MACSTSQCFRAKFLAHADSDRFPDTRLCADAQPDSYRDSQRSNQNHFQPNADPNTKSHSHANAIVSGAKYHANSHAYTRRQWKIVQQKSHLHFLVKG
jgi:hypothetical protein